ncbi:unnamed protein product, partial [marine sediment metagenome]
NYPQLEGYSSFGDVSNSLTILLTVAPSAFPLI